MFIAIQDGEYEFICVLKSQEVILQHLLLIEIGNVGLNDIKQDPQFQQSIWKESTKELEKASFDHLFSDYLPLYHEILTDEEGNFLVFHTDDCFIDCPILIEVYTPKGEFVCETEIKTGDYNLIIDRRRKHMCFTKSGLIALVQPKVDIDDFHLKMIKVGF